MQNKGFQVLFLLEILRNSKGLGETLKRFLLLSIEDKL